MQVGEIEYNHAHNPIQYNNAHTKIGDTDSQTTSICQQCAIRNDNIKKIEFRRSPAINTHICLLCSTPTYFLKMKSLVEHVKRFHEAFNQVEKGVK